MMSWFSPHLLSQSIYLSDLGLIFLNAIFSASVLAMCTARLDARLASLSLPAFHYLKHLRLWDTACCTLSFHHQVCLFQVCFVVTPQTCFVALIKLFFRYFQRSDKHFKLLHSSFETFIQTLYSKFPLILKKTHFIHVLRLTQFILALLTTHPTWINLSQDNNQTYTTTL